MKDYTKILPTHIDKYVGENDLYLEIFEGEGNSKVKPPILFVHGAYSGSWMWSKYIPHFVSKGFNCYAMNMRSHYKSRVKDLTKVSFEDYLEDIKELVQECKEAPILIGHSMGGILGQKIAETISLAGLVLVDSSVSKEVNKLVPYKVINEYIPKSIEPAPARAEKSSLDESEEDIIFQRKYLTMESAKALAEFSVPFGAKEGISINNSLVNCPCLVIKAVNSDVDNNRGLATAKQFNGEYTGFENTTHTGLLVGQRYTEVVDRILKWAERF